MPGFGFYFIAVVVISWNVGKSNNIIYLFGGVDLIYFFELIHDLLGRTNLNPILLIKTKKLLLFVYDPNPYNFAFTI